MEAGSGVGRQYGLVEAHPFKLIIESLGIFSAAPSWLPESAFVVSLTVMLTDLTDSDRIRAWISKLSLWYQTSPFGHAEERSGNNHQTGFYVMLTWMLVVQGDGSIAQQLLERAKYKLLLQLDPVRCAGSRPHSLTTRPGWWPAA